MDCIKLLAMECSTPHVNINPFFYTILEIEKIKWSPFKRLLPSKKDNHEFDNVFDNVKLYHYT
jgi:hypothetical protein